jgi:hypothetical protein
VANVPVTVPLPLFDEVDTVCFSIDTQLSMNFFLPAAFIVVRHLQPCVIVCKQPSEFSEEIPFGIVERRLGQIRTNPGVATHHKPISELLSLGPCFENRIGGESQLNRLVCFGRKLWYSLLTSLARFRFALSQYPTHRCGIETEFLNRRKRRASSRSPLMSRPGLLTREVKGRVDQRDVRKRLGKIPDQPLLLRIIFFANQRIVFNAARHGCSFQTAATTVQTQYRNSNRILDRL